MGIYHDKFGLNERDETRYFSNELPRYIVITISSPIQSPKHLDYKIILYYMKNSI
jgi:hypothetical protein